MDTIIGRIFNDGVSYEAAMNFSETELNDTIHELGLTGRIPLSQREKCELVALISTYVSIHGTDEDLYDINVIRKSHCLCMEAWRCMCWREHFPGYMGPVPFNGFFLEHVGFRKNLQHYPPDISLESYCEIERFARVIHYVMAVNQSHREHLRIIDGDIERLEAYRFIKKWYNHLSPQGWASWTFQYFYGERRLIFPEFNAWSMFDNHGRFRRFTRVLHPSPTVRDEDFMAVGAIVDEMYSSPDGNDIHIWIGDFIAQGCPGGLISGKHSLDAVLLASGYVVGLHYFFVRWLSRRLHPIHYPDLNFTQRYEDSAVGAAFGVTGTIDETEQTNENIMLVRNYVDRIYPGQSEHHV